MTHGVTPVHTPTRNGNPTMEMKAGQTENVTRQPDGKMTKRAGGKTSISRTIGIDQTPFHNVDGMNPTTVVGKTKIRPQKTIVGGTKPSNNMAHIAHRLIASVIRTITLSLRMSYRAIFPCCCVSISPKGFWDRLQKIWRSRSYNTLTKHGYPTRI